MMRPTPRSVLGVGGALILALCSACDTGASPEVGDDYGGGKVTGVAGDSHCKVVSIQHEPEWGCSDEQSQVARSYASSDPFSAPMTAAAG